MKKLLYIISILVIVLGTSSCEQDLVKYKSDGSVEASFPSTLVNFALVSEDNGQITIEMWRGNSKSAASIPVTITGATDVFTPQKQQFDFEAGSNKAYLTFTYPDINNFAGETYKITVAITNPEDISISGRSSMVISAQRKLSFQSLGTGSFTSEFFEESWPITVMKAAEADYYRLPGCYFTNYNIEFSINGSTVSFAKQPTGYNHSTYGMVSWDPRFMGESTVQGKDITFVVAFTVSAGSFGKFYEELVLP